MRSVTCTMMGAMQLGRMCRRMMVECFAPMALAASMYSTSRTVSTALRTTRANRGTEAIPRAMMRLTVLVPSAATITMANMVIGMAMTTSIKRMITLSTTPPK